MYSIIWVCVCSLNYSACKVHPPCYMVVCGPSGSTVFFNVASLKERFSEKKRYWRLNGFFYYLHSSVQTVQAVLVLRTIQRDVIINLHINHVKHSWFSDFNETWIFLTDFRKILKYYVVWKSVQRDQSLSMRTDGRTKCNRLLRLGRPVGAVTLSRWEWWWNERRIWGARGGTLNLISTNYPDHGQHGSLPLSRKNAHGTAGNRTRDLMVSSQELWPPSHEAGLTCKICGW